MLCFEEVPAVPQRVRNVNELPGHQFLEADTDVRARNRESVRDFIGMQGLG